MTVTVDTTFGTDITAGSWTIDPSHSEVGFTVRHLMSKVRGQFEKFEGTLTTGDSLEEHPRHRDHRPELGQHPRRAARRPPALR